MLTLNIGQPTDNAVVPFGTTFRVSGEASDAGMPEPRAINTVTVQVDRGPLIGATLTGIPNRDRTLVAFEAFPQVTVRQDPHVITVTATNDVGISVRRTVHVFMGTPIVLVAPAMRLEISPAPIDPGKPENKTRIDRLVSQIQTRLVPLSTLLASIGKTLAGPNLVLAAGPSNSTVLRIGLWVVGPDVPVVAAQPPNFPLPVLSHQAATAGFNTVPLLELPPTTGIQLLAYGIVIPTTTLQQMVDAVFPTLAKAVANSISLESVTVTCTGPSPSSVSTTFIGQVGFPSATVTGTITEVLGTTAVAGTLPPQSIPAITASSHSSSSSVLDELLLGLISPMFLLELEPLIIAIGTAIGVGQVAGRADAIARGIVASIPTTVPFRNTIGPLLPPFPMIVPNWLSFGASNSGLRGSGTITIPARAQTMVALAIAGPTRIRGYQADLAGGVDEIYDLAWANLVPDPDKFTWQVSGTGADRGLIGFDPLTQRGALTATFPLALNVQPGRYGFTLSVDATETSGVDSTKKLTASRSIHMAVDVMKNPTGLP